MERESQKNLPEYGRFGFSNCRDDVDIDELFESVGNRKKTQSKASSRDCKST